MRIMGMNAFPKAPDEHVSLLWDAVPECRQSNSLDIVLQHLRQSKTFVHFPQKKSALLILTSAASDDFCKKHGVQTVIFLNGVSSA